LAGVAGGLVREATDQKFNMKRILGWILCLVVATIFSGALLLRAEEAPGIADEKTPYMYKFSKREFESVGRTSFTLEVKPSRPDLMVVAVCFLQDEQQTTGRFPLGNVNADGFIKKSTIRVEIREKQTNKHVRALELSLQDAVPEVVGNSVKER
jgi:hypothetical protein